VAAMRKRQRGMTLLEIMIVLGIIALVMGLVIVPTVIKNKDAADREVAKLAVQRYAEQDYPRWTLVHRDAACPDSLADLSGKSDNDDPWGVDYKMYCGTSAPAQDVAFGAASFGPDRRENTSDDIRSW
jgi:prepilin-type N-terminal cleavage/methylation domain-containing protein